MVDLFISSTHAAEYKQTNKQTKTRKYLINIIQSHTRSIYSQSFALYNWSPLRGPWRDFGLQTFMPLLLLALLKLYKIRLTCECIFALEIHNLFHNNACIALVWWFNLGIADGHIAMTSKFSSLFAFAIPGGPKKRNSRFLRTLP